MAATIGTSPVTTTINGPAGKTVLWDLPYIVWSGNTGYMIATELENSVQTTKVYAFTLSGDTLTYSSTVSLPTGISWSPVAALAPRPTVREVPSYASGWAYRNPSSAYGTAGSFNVGGGFSNGLFTDGSNLFFDMGELYISRGYHDHLASVSRLATGIHLIVAVSIADGSFNINKTFFYEAAGASGISGMKAFGNTVWLFSDGNTTNPPVDQAFNLSSARPTRVSARDIQRGAESVQPGTTRSFSPLSSFIANNILYISNRSDKYAAFPINQSGKPVYDSDEDIIGASLPSVHTYKGNKVRAIRKVPRTNLSLTPFKLLSYTFSSTGNPPIDPPVITDPPTILPSTPLVSREDRIAYAICKRVWSIPATSEADTPIKVHKTEDGVEVPIDLDLSTVLEAVNHPLKKDRNVRWSDISMDRKDKLLLSTYNTAPPEDGSPINSCIIIIPFKASGRTPVKTDEISFINGTKTTTTNELAFVDEIGKRIYLLDTSDDSWKDDKYPLYAVNKISRDVSEQLRMQILSTIRQHPLGKRYISGGSPVDNPLYSYDEFLPGVNSNLFPKYINSYSMGIEVGEFRSGVWRYFENTFKFNAFKNSRDYQSDRSHNSTLYSKGSKIQYMYTPTFNASALRTIDGGPWKAITSKLSTSNRHELLAMLDDNSIEWYRWTGTSVEKARTLTPTGFDLINPTGLEWTGNNLYICDSGQKDDQIQKYSVSTTAITWVKTIVNPSRQDGLSLSARCRVIEDRQTVTEEECIDVPGPTPSSDKWYSGILPIDEISPGISGRNISLKIKIDHNQYLDIGTVFLEGSRPRPRK